MKKRVEERMRDLADRLMFGTRKRTGMLRLFSSAPIAIPLIFWAAVLQKLQEPRKDG